MYRTSTSFILAITLLAVSSIVQGQWHGRRLLNSIDSKSYRIVSESITLQPVRHSSKKRLRRRKLLSDDVISEWQVSLPHAWEDHHESRVLLSLTKMNSLLHPNFQNIVFKDETHEIVNDGKIPGQISDCLYQGHMVDASTGRKLEDSSAVVSYCHDRLSVVMSRHAEDDSSLLQTIDKDSFVVHRRSALNEEFKCALGNGSEPGDLEDENLEVLTSHDHDNKLTSNDHGKLDELTSNDHGKLTSNDHDNKLTSNDHGKLTSNDHDKLTSNDHDKRNKLTSNDPDTWNKLTSSDHRMPASKRDKAANDDESEQHPRQLITRKLLSTIHSVRLAGSPATEEPKKSTSDDKVERGNVMQNSDNQTGGDNKVYKKVVELLIVNPARRYERYGNMVHLHSASLVAMMQELYNRLGATYQITFVITGMVTFTEKDPFEFSDRNQIENVLERFNEWRIKALEAGLLPNHDAAHLVSGGDFFTIDPEKNVELENVVGFAQLDGMCGLQRVGVSQGTSSSDLFVASVMAHEIGHNLGIRHTDEYWKAGLVKQPCYFVGSDFLMNRASKGVGEWSLCSRQWLAQFFEGVLEQRIAPGYGKGGTGGCLDDAPQDKTSLWSSSQAGSRCGNGLREPGEECDCLDNDCSLSDPCCDGATCRLKADATCSILDGCCDPATCAPRNQGHVCRRALNVHCDIEEVCDGESSLCPLDDVVDIGTTCELNTWSGTCYGGNCVTYDAQCLALSPFKDDSSGVSYEFTGISTFPIGDYCGALQCAFIRPEPANNVVEISGPEGVYMVADGTPCDETGVGVEMCYKNRCVPSAEVPPSPAQTCSNGVLDAGETDVDCGGEDCFPCIESKSCYATVDCSWPMTCVKTTESDSVGVCEDRFEIPEPDPTNLLSEFELWVRFNFELFIVLCVLSTIFLVALSIAIFPCRCLLGEEREKRVLRARSVVARSVVEAPVTAARRVRTESLRVAEHMRRGSLELYDSFSGGSFRNAEYSNSIDEDEEGLSPRHRPRGPTLTMPGMNRKGSKIPKRQRAPTVVNPNDPRNRGESAGSVHHNRNKSIAEVSLDDSGSMTNVLVPSSSSPKITRPVRSNSKLKREERSRTESSAFGLGLFRSSSLMGSPKQKQQLLRSQSATNPVFQEKLARKQSATQDRTTRNPVMQDKLSRKPSSTEDRTRQVAAQQRERLLGARKMTYPAGQVSPKPRMDRKMTYPLTQHASSKQQRVYIRSPSLFKSQPKKSPAKQVTFDLPEVSEDDRINLDDMI